MISSFEDFSRGIFNFNLETVQQWIGVFKNIMEKLGKFVPDSLASASMLASAVANTTQTQKDASSSDQIRLILHSAKKHLESVSTGKEA